MGLISREEMRREITANLWKLAMMAPEDTRGRFNNQIEACKLLYRDHRYEPALRRLNELARNRVKPCKSETIYAKAPR